MILETSWEVCNKMGGIYTVLSSRAREMMAQHKGKVVFVGPLFGDVLPKDFIPEAPDLLKPWINKAQSSLPYRTITGIWRVPGEPAVVLVDFSPIWQERDNLYYRMWETYMLESDQGYGDYDECSLFSIVASQIFHSLVDTLKAKKPILIYNEWQTAMGLLYTKATRPELRTLFITHATTVGRSIAGNGKELYAYMQGYNGDQMAHELNVVAKHAVEKRAAHATDCFATVSRLTARECTQLIERTPIVLPNGFEDDFVPKGRAFDKACKAARARLSDIASHLTGQRITDKDLFVSLGGRYEYRNKGLDLFVESIAHLRNIYKGKRKITAFILVPARVAEPRADLKYLLDNINQEQTTQTPSDQYQALQHPTLTHWLHNMEDDATQRHLKHLRLEEVHELVNIIHIPVYLDANDGIVGLSYYDLLIGMDMTIYPSYYEPWGYTPLESIAFGIPTVTTTLAGFGLWADEALQRNDRYQKQGTPVYVLERTDNNTQEVLERIAQHIQLLSTGKLGTSKGLREEAMALAEQAQWRNFYKYYQNAYRSLK